MNDKYKAVEKLIVIIFMLLALAVVSSMDYQDEKISELERCSNVLQWELERVRDVDPYERTGWPPESEEERQRCKALADTIKQQELQTNE
jgi:hypothetical protein|tara:strand:+ start:391 stop:660 length:270 start_codon:yes stop_codon:yes gene_type:complete